MKTQVCVTCNKELEIKYFSIRTDTGKYRGQCKKCHKGYLTDLKDKQQEIKELFDNNLKKCGKCKETKTLDEFNFDKYTSTKLTSCCKECAKLKGVKYRETEDAKRVLLKLRYNATDDNFNNFMLQNNCNICNKVLTKKDKHYDHDHKTGDYRGALCKKCNLGIGYFNDNPLILNQAIIYLNKFIKQ